MTHSGRAFAAKSQPFAASVWDGGRKPRKPVDNFRKSVENLLNASRPGGTPKPTFQSIRGVVFRDTPHLPPRHAASPHRLRRVPQGLSADFSTRPARLCAARTFHVLRFRFFGGCIAPCPVLYCTQFVRQALPRHIAAGARSGRQPRPFPRGLPGGDVRSAHGWTRSRRDGASLPRKCTGGGTSS